jgi:surface protein
MSVYNGPSIYNLCKGDGAVQEMTLRFMFSDSSYNPQAAGVGTSGTWRKKLNTNYNVWDWTNHNSDWSYAFQDAFQDAGNEVEIIDSGNTNGVTNLLRFLSGCTSLKSICLFDTSNVNSMVSMFNGASRIENVPLFNTENVTAMNSMFANCSSLLNIPEYNTSKVTSFGRFAQGCTSIKKVPLFNAPRSTVVEYMFIGCRNVDEGTLDLYNYLANKDIAVTTYTGCFTNCGIDTVTGAAELAQIPSSWGGTGA